MDHARKEHMKAYTRPEANGRPPSRAALRPQKTAMLLAQRIVGEITERGLKTGASLLSEKDMLEEYGVARGTLREALRFLEIQGVISIKTGPGGGPIVAEASSRPLASMIALLLQRTDAPFRSVVEAREVLEPALAAMAATRVSDAQLRELEDCIEVMRANLSSVDHFLYENERFHAIVAEAADNHVFEFVIGSLKKITDATPLGVDYPPETRSSVADHHQRIYDAIKAGDADAASRAMSVHIADFKKYLRKYYPTTMDEPLRWDQVSW
jgi:GntR family transcriptional repressor for pyruvate dehydrogenase complex